MTCIHCGRDVTLISHVCGFCMDELFDITADHATRRILLYRTEDESGVSGEGVVAVGVVMPSGKAAIEWLNDANPNLNTDGNGWAIYDSVDDARKVHGHGGKTKVIIE